MKPRPIAEQEHETPALYWIIVIELSDTCPRRNPRLPHVYVGMTAVEPDSRIDQIRRGAKPRWVRTNAVSVRRDLMGAAEPVPRMEARKRKKALVCSLERQGYTVNNRDTPVWSVYVVQLDEEHLDDVGTGWVYVAETSKTPEQRLLQHKSGRSDNPSNPSSSTVYRHGLHLREDLMTGLSPLYSSVDSRKAERELAASLTAQGYRVSGGH